MTPNYDQAILYSRLVNYEAESNTFSGLRGSATSVPLDLDSLASQHTTPNVGGDTLRDNSAKYYLPIESWLLRISLLCQMELFVSSSQNNNNFSGPIFKLQPNPVSTRLALTRGRMANGSHAIEWISLSGYPHSKICETEEYF